MGNSDDPIPGGVGRRLVAERYRLGFLDSEGQREFAEKLGMPQAKLQQLESAVSDPPTLADLAAFGALGVDLRFVLTGQGDMTVQEREFLGRYRQAVGEDRGRLKSAGHSLTQPALALTE